MPEFHLRDSIGSLAMLLAKRRASHRAFSIKRGGDMSGATNVPYVAALPIDLSPPHSRTKSSFQISIFTRDGVAAIDASAFDNGVHGLQRHSISDASQCKTGSSNQALPSILETADAPARDIHGDRLALAQILTLHQTLPLQRVGAAPRWMRRPRWLEWHPDGSSGPANAAPKLCRVESRGKASWPNSSPECEKGRKTGLGRSRG